MRTSKIDSRRYRTRDILDNCRLADSTRRLLAKHSSTTCLLYSKQNQPRFQLNQLSWSNLSELRHANGTRPSFNSALHTPPSFPSTHPPIESSSFTAFYEFVRSFKRSRPRAAPDVCMYVSTTVVARYDRYSTPSPLIINTRFRFIYTPFAPLSRLVVRQHSSVNI